MREVTELLRVPEAVEGAVTYTYPALAIKDVPSDEKDSGKSSPNSRKLEKETDRLSSKEEPKGTSRKLLPTEPDKETVSIEEVSTEPSPTVLEVVGVGTFTRPPLPTSDADRW